MEVIGYEILSGVFEKDGKSIPWENIRIYVTQDIRNGEGKKSKFLTVKRDKLPVPLNTIIHSRVKNVFYDEHQKVAMIEFEF